MTQQPTLILFDWQEFKMSEPWESDKWASTDRGWVYLMDHPDAANTLYPDDHTSLSRCVGNYLDYAPCGPHHANRPDGAVHACAYIFRKDSPLLAQRNVSLGSRWCKDIPTAKAWIEDTVTTYLQGAA